MPYFLIGTVVLLVGMVSLFIFITRTGRMRFCLQRQPMTNQMFLERVNTKTAHSGVALALRSAIADQCGVPPEMIQDTDECDFLREKLAFDGWDEVEFIMSLEDRLGIKLDDRMAAKIPMPGDRDEKWLPTLPTLFGKRKGRETVAAWICRAVSYIEEQLIASNRVGGGIAGPAPTPPAGPH